MFKYFNKLQMKITFSVSMLVLACAQAAASNPEIQIPRSSADKGRYFLIEMTRKGDIVSSLHKRVGVMETGYSRVESNCKTLKYRDMGYSEDGPEKIKINPGQWTEAISGSSKGDLLQFVCNRKQ